MQTKKDISRKKRGSAWKKPKSERSVPHRRWKTQ